MNTKVYGIDVSYHQGVIDWQKTASELRRVNGGKNPGFAFLRVGRSNLDGKGGLSLDSQWKNNLAGCEANGVPVGVYWYCYDESVAAVMQTAHDVVDQLKGHKFDYPIVFDMEYEPFNTGEETSDPDKKRPIEDVRATNTAMIQIRMWSRTASGSIPARTRSALPVSATNWTATWLTRTTPASSAKPA